MDQDDISLQRRRVTPRRDRSRLVTAICVALAAAVGVYILARSGTGGAIGYAVLVVLPASLSAFVAWVGSIRRNWSRATFALVPVWLTIGAAVLGAIAFGEGVVCILMLTPLWLGFGLLGVWPVYRYRQQQEAVDPGIFRANALLLLPFFALLIDQNVEPPSQTYRVVREIVVSVPADAIWPRLLAIPDIAPDEGRWTFSQSVVRLPRPLDARLSGAGIGAVREARWQDDIRFQEIITRWEQGRSLQWRFAFPDPSIRLHTDEHIDPHSRRLWVDAGGYDLIPLPDGSTKIRLWTRYRATTPLNAYAAMWGEVILGDIQDNVLAILASRIKRTAREGSDE